MLHLDVTSTSLLPIQSSMKALVRENRIFCPVICVVMRILTDGKFAESSKVNEVKKRLTGRFPGDC